MGKGMLSWPGPDCDVLQPIDGAVLIGSAADSAIRVQDAAPRHCHVSRTAEGYVARDLTGQKLVRVNGVRVDQQVLQPGDVLQVGSGRFSFSLVDEPDPPPTGPPAPAIRLTERPRPRRPAAKKARLWVAAAVGAPVLVAAALLLWPSPDPSPVVKSPVRKPIESAPPPPEGLRGVREAPPRPAPPTPEVVEARPEIPAEPPRLFLPPPEPGPSFRPTPEPRAVPAILRHFDRPDRVDAAAEAEARTSPVFAHRYAALLLQLHRAFARGTGYEASYRALLDASPAGGPEGAAAHLKALAESLKEAIYCKECRNGKAPCTTCQGKGRVDLPCAVCEGRGRVRPSGAIGETDVTVKCRNCDGLRIFRGVTCAGCARSGVVLCASCKGAPWREGKCYGAGCKDGRLTCAGCQGKGWDAVKCPFCTGGRARAPGAVGDADVTMKCRNCEIDGRQGNGTFRQDCKACGRTGKVTCEGCGGAFSGKERGGFREVPISRVFRSEGCAVASGGSAAHECPKCIGLGVRIRPASDPSKTLD